jgi:hypothetical protein
MRSAVLMLAGFLAMAEARAANVVFDPDYPGSEAIADGEGFVHVKVVFFPDTSCWKVVGVREGVHDPVADQPTQRHLYVTVNVAETDKTCPPTSMPLHTTVVIPDKPGRLSLDIFFVDARDKLIRSQRHLIRRDP